MAHQRPVIHRICLTDIAKDDIVRALRADHQHELADIVEQMWRDEVAQAARRAAEEEEAKVRARKRLEEMGLIWDPLDPFGVNKGQTIPQH